MAIRKRRRTSFEEWLSWRDPNLNASEAPALFGMDKFRTALELFYQKLGIVPPTEETRRMRLGRWFEPAVIEAVREQYPGWTIIPQRHYYDDPELRIGCTPDAFMINPDGIKYNLQCKVISEHSFRRYWTGQEEEEEEDEGNNYHTELVTTPVGYQLQTNIETQMTGCVGGKVGALIIERAKIYVLDVPKHEESYEATKEQAQVFWEQVRTNSPPPLDCERDARLIKELYPKDDGSTVDLSDHPDLVRMVREELLLAAQVKQYTDMAKPHKKKREEIRTFVKSLMGSATRAILPGHEMTWKVQERRASTSRVLRIKESVE